MDYGNSSYDVAASNNGFISIAAAQSSSSSSQQLDSFNNNNGMFATYATTTTPSTVDHTSKMSLPGYFAQPQTLHNTSQHHQYVHALLGSQSMSSSVSAYPQQQQQQPPQMSFVGPSSNSVVSTASNGGSSSLHMHPQSQHSQQQHHHQQFMMQQPPQHPTPAFFHQVGAMNSSSSSSSYQFMEMGSTPSAATPSANQQQQQQQQPFLVMVPQVTSSSSAQGSSSSGGAQDPSYQFAPHQQFTAAPTYSPFAMTSPPMQQLQMPFSTIPPAASHQQQQQQGSFFHNQPQLSQQQPQSQQQGLATNNGTSSGGGGVTSAPSYHPGIHESNGPMIIGGRLRHGGNAHTELKNACKYFAYRDADHIRANYPQHQPNPKDQLLPLFVQMYPSEHKDQAATIFEKVLTLICGPGAGSVVGVEPRSDTSFIVFVRTGVVWHVIYNMRYRVLMDRHGFWYAENLQQYAIMREYCENVRTLPQQSRHAKTDGMPSMPLVIELSRTMSRTSITAPPAPAPFDIQVSATSGTPPAAPTTGAPLQTTNGTTGAF